MRYPRSLLLAPALALGIAGCQTLTSPPVVNTLREVCQYEPLAYAAFQLFAPQANPNVVVQVNRAHAIVRGICANPPTDAASAFAMAYSAYMIITGATR